MNVQKLWIVDSVVHTICKLLRFYHFSLGFLTIFLLVYFLMQFSTCIGSSMSLITRSARDNQVHISCNAEKNYCEFVNFFRVHFDLFHPADLTTFFTHQPLH